jgi:hypothetical protein
VDDRFPGVIAAFTVALVGVGFFQWKAMVGQQSLMQAQLDEMKSGGKDTHDLAIAARDQAEASKELSALTGKQFVSSQQLIDSQRASLNVSMGRVLNPVTFHDGQPSIAFSIIIGNPGAIKATNVAVRSTAYYSSWGNEIFTEPLEKQRRYCGTKLPPPKDRYFKDGKGVGLTGLRDITFTIEPHSSSEHELNFGMAKPAQTELIKWPPPDATQRNPSLAVTDRIFPILVGCVDYESGAMPERHQTGFIFEIQEAYGEQSATASSRPTLIHYGVDLPRNKLVVTQFFFGQGRKY